VRSVPRVVARGPAWQRLIETGGLGAAGEKGQVGAATSKRCTLLPKLRGCRTGRTNSAAEALPSSPCLKRNYRPPLAPDPLDCPKGIAKS
jgi:hypothetical protein